jgi:two-component system response regulator YesN
MYNVLIVDDEPDICLGLCEIIDWNAYGFNVVDTASDGEDALEKLNNKKYDLLVTDIRMPVIGGLTLIRKIREKNLSIKIVILSGYNDFEFAKKAIEYSVNGYLLKPIDRDELTEYLVTIKEEIDKELKKKLFTWENKNIAKDRLLLDVVTGNLTAADIHKKMKDYDIDFQGTYYNIALLEIDNLYSKLENDFIDANLDIFSVKNIAEEVIQANNSGYVYEDSNGTIGIIFNGNAADMQNEKLVEYLQELRLTILKYLKLTVTIGYGETISSILDIKLSHKQAKQALELRSVAEKGEIIHYKNVFLNDNNQIKITWNADNLLAAIEKFSEGEIINEIKLLISEIAIKKITIDIAKVIFYNIIFDIGNLPKKYSLTDNNFFIQQDIIALNKRGKYLNIEYLEQLLTSTCINTCNYIREFQTSKRSDVIDKIQLYIGEHFSEDLTLKSISSIFYMNPVYLGRLFKNTTGDSFSDYVNKTRISEAKKMLMMDSSNIGRIIEKLGFSTQEYFYRLFPKYEGITFAEYKKNLKGK